MWRDQARERMTQARERMADERDRVADDRERLADERQRIANLRDDAADRQANELVNADHGDHVRAVLDQLDLLAADRSATRRKRQDERANRIAGPAVTRTAEDQHWTADRREFVADDRQEQADARELLADEREATAIGATSTSRRSPARAEPTARPRTRPQRLAATRTRVATRQPRRGRRQRWPARSPMANVRPSVASIRWRPSS